MEKKKIEVSLGILIIITLITIAVLGTLIYYFYNKSNTTVDLGSSDAQIRNSNVSSSEQVDDSNTEPYTNIAENPVQNVYSNYQNTTSYNTTTNKNTFPDNGTTVANNTSDTTSTLSQSGTDDFSSYKGVWRSDLVLDTDIPEEEFIINSINSNSINFDYIKYRTISFDNITAPLTNNIATFEISNENYSLKGTIMLSNNTVVLTITSSSLEYVNTGTYTFKSKTQYSVLK